MAALEFKFSSDQQHQLEAIEATCDLFRGQQFIGSVFSADSGRKGQTAIGELMVGHGNELRVAPGQLLDNLHAVQEEGCLPATDVLTDGRLRDFTVEMETGTGKTYVYIRSIYELNRRYGITKFVIVVPSVAIREGVLKSLQTTRRHFETLYDRTPLDYFVYDSKDMGPVGNFATSSSIQVMVINIDAFNKGLEKDGTAKEGNLFHRPSEKLTGGFSPRELVSACKPVVIIDEPQSVDNTKQAKAAIKSLNPLFVLRYSATHKQAYNMIYRLTPVDAFERHLVKGICVDSIKAEANLNGAYVRLESVKSDPFSAKVSIDVRQADGTQKRKAVTVKTGNDLYQKSGENSDYESGWVVNNIGAAVGDEFIEFQNGEVLELGEALGDVNEEVVKRAQIRRTIEDHLARVSATAKSAERATLSRRRRPRFPAGGATALWPPALPRAAAQGALDRGVVEVRGPDLNLQRRGALGVPGRDRPARDLPSAELREPDRHRDVLCAERGQPPRGVRGPHDCPLSGSPSPSAASASRSFMR